ncbi:uncharacterized protein MYCFIDRAFT_174539 [Pseudocercospora fijiensis CIRAD86]|uniref:Uncharacterized protein n=1 Tax=Pseudocercospora fijiensis (strain CIRAD86) TaxID=383855 RepID=M3AEL6_PSEFD|nr:uncharacterized protein MYCFIDRAFT_174539 [Pseudocercospora fijiensis CIRAD86]EME83051.1 hypothetical protein MYCFIDRAFT_174539 [Pseudocercospora fijiensis CIRAD86]
MVISPSNKQNRRLSMPLICPMRLQLELLKKPQDDTIFAYAGVMARRLRKKAREILDPCDAGNATLPPAKKRKTASEQPMMNRQMGVSEKRKASAGTSAEDQVNLPNQQALVMNRGTENIVEIILNCGMIRKLEELETGAHEEAWQNLVVICLKRFESTWRRVKHEHVEAVKRELSSSIESPWYLTREGKHHFHIRDHSWINLAQSHSSSGFDQCFAQATQMMLQMASARTGCIDENGAAAAGDSSADEREEEEVARKQLCITFLEHMLECDHFEGMLGRLLTGARAKLPLDTILMLAIQFAWGMPQDECLSCDDSAGVRSQLRQTQILSVAELAAGVVWKVRLSWMLVSRAYPLGRWQRVSSKRWNSAWRQIEAGFSTSPAHPPTQLHAKQTFSIAHLLQHLHHLHPGWKLDVPLFFTSTSLLLASGPVASAHLACLHRAPDANGGFSTSPSMTQALTSSRLKDSGNNIRCNPPPTSFSRRKDAADHPGNSSGEATFTMNVSDPLFVLRKACDELDRLGVTHEMIELSDKKTTTHKKIKSEHEEYDDDDGYPTPRHSPSPCSDEEAAEKKGAPGRKVRILAKFGSKHQLSSGRRAYSIRLSLNVREALMLLTLIRGRPRVQSKALAEVQGIPWRGKRPAVIAYTEKNDDFILEVMNRHAMSSGGQMIPLGTLTALYNEKFPNEEGRSARGLDSHIRRTTRLKEAKQNLCGREE